MSREIAQPTYLRTYRDFTAVARDQAKERFNSLDFSVGGISRDVYKGLFRAELKTWDKEIKKAEAAQKKSALGLASMLLRKGHIEQKDILENGHFDIEALRKKSYFDGKDKVLRVLSGVTLSEKSKQRQAAESERTKARDEEAVREAKRTAADEAVRKFDENPYPGIPFKRLDAAMFDRGKMDGSYKSGGSGEIKEIVKPVKKEGKLRRNRWVIGAMAAVGLVAAAVATYRDQLRSYADAFPQFYGDVLKQDRTEPGETGAVFDQPVPAKSYEVRVFPGVHDKGLQIVPIKDGVRLRTSPNKYTSPEIRGGRGCFGFDGRIVMADEKGQLDIINGGTGQIAELRRDGKRVNESSGDLARQVLSPGGKFKTGVAACVVGLDQDDSAKVARVGIFASVKAPKAAVRVITPTWEESQTTELSTAQKIKVWFKDVGQAAKNIFVS